MPNQIPTLKKGDHLVDAFDIYQILDVKDNNVYYVSVAPTDRNKNVSSYLPLVNILKAGLRPVASSSEIKTFLTQLSKKSTLENYDHNSSKEVVYKYDLTSIAPILKYLWLNRETISKPETELLNNTVAQVTREMSYVLKTTPLLAQRQLTTHLDQCN